jgi:hypothetical protein
MPSMMVSKGPRHLRSSFSALVRCSCFWAFLVWIDLRLSKDHHLLTASDMPVSCRANQAMPAGLIAPLQRMPGPPDGMQSTENKTGGCNADKTNCTRFAANRS